MSSTGRTILICAFALFLGISLFNSIGCSSYPANTGGGGGGGGGTGGVGGPGGTPTPVPSATVTATPQQSSLKGSYAFHLWGGPLAVSGGGTFFAMVGTFTSDGLGHITTGNEEVFIVNSSNSLNANQNIAITGGAYTINSAGIGQVSLTAANPTYSSVLGIVLISPQHALINHLDNKATAYGSADLQTTSDFTLAAIANTSYVFNGIGVDSFNSSATVVHAGVFSTDNTGSMKSGGVEDINDGGIPNANSSLVASPLPPPSPSTGRMIGNITNGVQVFSAIFYIVDSTHMKFIESEGGSIAAVGEIYTQSTISSTSPKAAAQGGYVFNLFTAEAVPSFTLAGQMVFDGTAGNISSGVLDSNAGGTIHTNSAITAGVGGTSNSHYSIDSRGRGTLTVVSATLPTKQFNFYPSIHGLALVEMDTSSANATMFAQAGTPFSNASVQGAYAVSAIGVSTGVSNSYSVVAQLNADGAGNFTNGTFSVDNSGTPNPLVTGSGTYTAIAATTGRGTIVLQSTALPETMNGVIYVIGPSGTSTPGFLFIQTDTNQLTKGHAFSQGNF